MPYMKEREIEGRPISFSYNEAMHIFHEIINHMEPEEAHHLLYEMTHRVFPEISKICEDRSNGEHGTRTAHQLYMDRENLRNQTIMEYSHCTEDFKLKHTLPKLNTLPKEDFLSKDDFEV